jgi:hypothetical protein
LQLDVILCVKINFEGFIGEEIYSGRCCRTSCWRKTHNNGTLSFLLKWNTNKGKKNGEVIGLMVIVLSVHLIGNEGESQLKFPGALGLEEELLGENIQVWAFTPPTKLMPKLIKR